MSQMWKSKQNWDWDCGSDSVFFLWTPEFWEGIYTLIKCHSPPKILLLQNDLEKHTFLWLCNWLQFVENISEPSCENVGMPMEKQWQVVLHLFFGFLVRHQDHDVIRQFVIHIRAKFFLKILNEIWRKSVNKNIDKLFLTNFARMAARIFSDTSALKPSIFLRNF